MSEEKNRQIYQEAHQAGLDAAEPIRYDKNYPYGWAYIMLDGRLGFSKWLIESELAKHHDYPRGTGISVNRVGGNYYAIMAYHMAFQEILADHGIECSWHGGMS